MKVIFVEIDRCIACRNCERICTFQQSERHNGDSANIFVHVDLDSRRIYAATCLQCEEALCMKACPTGALRRDPVTRAVVVDKTACVGCGMCVVACPFGSVHLDQAARKAAKCDLCGGDPKCVQVCMAKALHFADINELAVLKQKRADRRFCIRAVSHRWNPEP